MRMGGVNYEVYILKEHLLDIEEYHKTLNLPAYSNESCSTKATPHCPMITAGIGIQMALSDISPFSVIGNLRTFAQNCKWTLK